MPFSLLGGLEAGRRALMSHQYELTNIGHNIANVNTPGYSRQQVMLDTTPPYESTEGKFGTGVRVATVRQIRDYFLTAQYRKESESQGRWQSTDRTMSQVENVLLEPSENSLNDLLNGFFNAWQQLTTAADSQTARSTLREQASLLINGFHQASRRMDDIIENLDDDIVARVGELNQIAGTVSEINRQISFAELDGNTANDLRDRRDKLIDELSSKVRVQVIQERSGAVRVFIGSMEFIGNGHYQPLGTQVESTGNRTIHQIVWAGSKTRLAEFGGELDALIEARDEILPDYIRRLDTLAGSLVRQVNAQHVNGYGANNRTGINFFDPSGTTATTINLSQEVTDDVSGIVASSLADSPGNNEIALAIAGLKSALTMDNNAATFSEYYASLVGLVGVQARQAADSKENYDLVLSQLESSRQAVQGVSLDEEMTNMIRAQHAYDAAARMVVTISEAMSTIVDELGVGR